MSNRLNMAVIETVFTLWQRGWSRRRIARALGLDRATVESNWLGRKEPAQRKKSRSRIEEAAVRRAELADLNYRTATVNAAGIDFAGTGRQTQKLIAATGIGKSLGGRPLFEGLDVVLAPGTKLGLLGANGSGKSTILKIFSGELTPDAGTVTRADGLQLEVFEQGRSTLDLSQPLRRALSPNSDEVLYRGQSMHVGGWASRFLFRSEQLDVQLSALSGGEQARVRIAVLFRSRYHDALTFKGGTSLSKVFGVINRFSEEIDLSLSPSFLKLPEPGASQTQGSKWMQNAEAECARVVQDDMQQVLETEVVAVLGQRKGPWLEYQTDPATHSPVLFFHYPSTQPTGFDYLKRSVKLELGSLTEQQPVGGIRCGRGLPRIFRAVSRIGSARLWHWNWSDRSGRRRRSCTWNTIAPRSGRCRTGIPVITRTRPHWRATRLSRLPCRITHYGTAWSPGKAISSAAAGHGTISQSPARSDWSRRRSEFQPFAATIKPCVTCILLSQRHAIRSSAR